MHMPNNISKILAGALGALIVIKGVAYIVINTIHQTLGESVVNATLTQSLDILFVVVLILLVAYIVVIKYEKNQTW